MNQVIEHLTPPDLATTIEYIVKGDTSVTPAVPILQYGGVLTSSELSKLNIPTADPAATIK